MQISVGLGPGIGVQRQGALIDKEHGDDLRLVDPCVRIFAGSNLSNWPRFDKVSRYYHPWLGSMP